MRQPLHRSAEIVWVVCRLIICGFYSLIWFKPFNSPNPLGTDVPQAIGNDASFHEACSTAIL